MFPSEILRKVEYLCFIVLSRFTILLLALALKLSTFAQLHPLIRLETSAEQCEKGVALIFLPASHPKDSLVIEWSTGPTNQNFLRGLSAGNYFVRIFLQRKDSVHQKFDTLINFEIEKLRCPVSVPKYFSPNEDDYNDFLEISNIDRYPDFELLIFNRSGQRIHHQQKTYEHWDGKWLGINLPDDTYYYLLFYDKENKSEFIKGDITLIR